MSNYVNAAAVICDGEELKDVKKIRVGKRTLRKSIRVMRRRGRVKLTPEYTIELDAAIPEEGSEYDYESIEGKTVTIEYENGTKEIFLECSVMEIGDEELDGENETIRKVTLSALDRQVQ